MLTKQSHLSKDEIRDQLGWDIKPEGACQGEWCLPVSIDEEAACFEVKAIAKALHMPLVEEPELGLCALGPSAVAGHALTSKGAELRCLTLVATSLSDSRRGHSVHLGTLLRLRQSPVRVAGTTKTIRPKGAELITVGMDTLGAAIAHQRFCSQRRAPQPH